MSEIGKFTIDLNATIRDAISCIDKNAKGIALVIDGDHRLLSTITDGDIRRAILAGVTFDTPVSRLMMEKEKSKYPKPICVTKKSTDSEMLSLMKDESVRQLPVLDEEGRVVDLVVLSDLVPEEKLAVRAVIMAGGKGTRLRPLTEKLPKPMLPVGDRPLMERTIEQLRRSGIRNVNITTHFQPEKIVDHFGDGKAFGVTINYLPEDEPLGTAGALDMMEDTDEPVLVINGDVLTRVDYRAMLNYHREHSADMTIGVRKYDLQVPYGVIDSDGPNVRKLREKPVIELFVNAGIYLLEPGLNRYLPDSGPFDMTELIQRMIDDGSNVVNFPIVEYWLDIGHPADYEQAQQDVENGELKK